MLMLVVLMVMQVKRLHVQANDDADDDVDALPAFLKDDAA